MTTDFYQQHAEDFFNATVHVDMRTLYQPFIEQLPSQGRILDAGCGSGRDSKAFKECSFNVTAFDASTRMVALASKHAGILVQHQTFVGFNETARYDGIWCCASLLHVPLTQLPDVIQRLARGLKPGGTWYISFKYGHGEHEKDGRHFTDLNEVELGALVQMLPGINILATWQTEDKRLQRNELWLNALLRKA